MAEKRKHSDSQTDSTTVKKAKAEHSARRKEKKAHKSKHSKKHEDVQQPPAGVSQLRHLVDDLTSSPENVQKVAAEGGEQLVAALKILGQAFTDSDRLTDEPPQDGDAANIQDVSAKTLPKPPPIKDACLETAVFTHQSIAPDDPEGKEEKNYDKLEFLGDAYIQVISTKFAWSKFSHLRTGRISQIREILVNNDTLGCFAVEYGFDKRLNVREDHRRMPKLWAKIKGDVFEAYVGAAILSNPVNGYTLVEDWLSELWLPKVEGIAQEPPIKHYKEDLAKRIAGKGIKIRYIDESPAVRHKMGIQTFFIGVYLTGWGYTNQHLGSGQGVNKVEAGNEAASRALANHPLIDEIAAIKQEFDAKVRAERAKLELAEAGLPQRA